MRSKEQAHDYRYFPDPDLLPLVLEPELGRPDAGRLPELPDAKKARFVAEYGLQRLRRRRAGRRAGDRRVFSRMVAKGRDAKAAANWVIGDLFGALNRLGKGIEDSPVGADSARRAAST